jgi:DNA-binding CsgD family transcriptional regulator
VRSPLTSRQAEALAHLADGHAGPAIARLMHSSERTVREHLAALYGVLGARNGPHAVHLAHTAGLLTVAPRPDAPTDPGLRDRIIDAISPHARGCQDVECSWCDRAFEQADEVLRILAEYLAPVPVGADRP